MEMNVRDGEAYVEDRKPAKKTDAANGDKADLVGKKRQTREFSEEEEDMDFEAIQVGVDQANI